MKISETSKFGLWGVVVEMILLFGHVDGAKRVAGDPGAGGVRLGQFPDRFGDDPALW